MPVAGRIALDIVADAQDKATATLRAVQGELRKTEEQLKQVTATSEDSPFFTEDRKTGLEGRRRKQFLDEAAALEQATQRRREQVVAERAARAQQVESISVGEKFKAGVEASSRGVEFFNKTMGLLGFAGVIGGAVTGVVALVDELLNLNSATRQAEEQQETFNTQLAQTKQLLADIAEDRAPDQNARSMIERQRRIEELINGEGKYLELQQKRQVAEAAIVTLASEEERLRKSLATQGGRDYETEVEIKEVVRQQAQLRNQVADSLVAEAGLVAEIKNLQREQGTSLTQMVGTASGLVGLYERARDALLGAARAPGAILEAAVEQGEAVAKKQAADDAAKKKEEEAARRAGAAAAAARRQAEQAAADELARARIAFETRSDYERTLKLLELDRGRIERDFSDRKISAKTRELQLAKLELELMRAIATENDRVSEETRKRSEDAEREAEKKREAAGKMLEEQGRREEEARRAGLEDQARQIESIGEAAERAVAPLAKLDGRLAGLGSTVRETAGIWASYTRGQQSLGEAIAGTLGQTGAAVAQAIDDRKDQALVEGGFNAAAALAAGATGDVRAAIGHAAAAASFFALAGQGGGASAGGGGASPTSSAPPSTPAPTNRDRVQSGGGAPSVQIVQFGRGVVYGLGADVARASEDARSSLRGTGMYRRRY